MNIDLQMIKKQTADALAQFLEISPLTAGEIFVLGCSSSEICGAHIGKAGNEQVGAAVIDVILPMVRDCGGYLAVQGCEHINRALAVEREAAQKYGLEIVSVVPAPRAGGSCAAAAYRRLHDPVMVEHITAKMGMDIGDTAIGMHIKFVQVPVRISIKEIGRAHLTCLTSRPKLIGGERAQYI